MIWTWPNLDGQTTQSTHNLLVLCDGTLLLFMGLFPKFFAEWEDEMQQATSGADAIARVVRRKGGPLIVRADQVRSVQRIVYRLSQRIEIRYVDDKSKKDKRARFSVPPERTVHSGAQIFHELRTALAPSATVEKSVCSVWSAISGPFFSLIFGGGISAVCAVASTTTERAAVEYVSGVRALAGSLIRLLGPTTWTVICILWSLGSAALLLRRLVHRPMREIWQPAFSR
jgi:hypothetical protein